MYRYSPFVVTSSTDEELRSIYGGPYTVGSYGRGINLVSTYIHISDKIYEMEGVTDKTNLPLKTK
jgi:hypothetical protein